MQKLMWREPIETTVIRSSGEDQPALVPEPRVRVRTLNDLFGRESGAILILLVTFGAFTIASGEFLTANNLANLARQVSIYGIIAVGQLMVILTGGIDLAVGSVVGIAGAVTAMLLVSGMPVVPAILIGLVMGTVIGLAVGLLVTKFNLPPFIATLGMLGIARGVVMVITDAKTIQGLPDSFRFLGNGSILGIPNLLIFFVLVTIIAVFVLKKTVFGRYVYAVGSNVEAARLAGVPVRLVTTVVYVISGLLAALGGVLLTARLGAGIPTNGTGFELQAIAACVIGGASLAGARGTALGAALGALLIGVLTNGGNLLAIDPFYLQIAIGVLIIAAVAFDQMSSSPRSRA